MLGMGPCCECRRFVFWQLGQHNQGECSLRPFTYNVIFDRAIRYGSLQMAISDQVLRKQLVGMKAAYRLWPCPLAAVALYLAAARAPLSGASRPIDSLSYALATFRPFPLLLFAWTLTTTAFFRCVSCISFLCIRRSPVLRRSGR